MSESAREGKVYKRIATKLLAQSGSFTIRDVTEGESDTSVWNVIYDLVSQGKLIRIIGYKPAHQPGKTPKLFIVKR